MKTLKKIKNKLTQKFGYKFQKEERARLKDTKEEGIILDRCFPFDKFAFSFLPGKYYSFQTQKRGIYPNNSPYTLNLAKIGCRESHLEKVMKEGK